MIKSSFWMSRFLVPFVLVGCAQLKSQKDFNEKRPLEIRVQNMLGLQTKATGCSLGNLGGIHLMTEHSKAHPVDLTIEVGPAFHPILSGPFSKIELLEERKSIWNQWREQKVDLYAVDALDLSPSLDEFKKDSPSSILLLSTNLVDPKTKKPLFEPFWIVKTQGKVIGFLGLTEGSSDETNEWSIKEPVIAFTEALHLFPDKVDLIYVLGALSPATRTKISSLSQTPLLFLGGTVQERNTTRLLSLDSKHFFARTPAFGTGFSEILLSAHGKDFKDKKFVKEIGGLYHSFFSDLLSEKKKAGAQCGTPNSGQ